MYVSLALIGLLFVGAHCGESDFDAVVLNSNLFGNQPAENSQFWWMSKGSPFKRAVAAGPPQQQFDFNSNPFIRCKFQLISIFILTTLSHSKMLHMQAFFLFL